MQPCLDPLLSLSSHRCHCLRQTLQIIAPMSFRRRLDLDSLRPRRSVRPLVLRRLATRQLHRYRPLLFLEAPALGLGQATLQLLSRQM